MGRSLRFRLLFDRGDGACQDVRHAFHEIAFGIPVVDLFDVRGLLLVIGDVGFHGEGPVVVEPLDGFGMGLNELLGQSGILGDRVFLKQIHGGGINVVVIRKIGQVAEALFFNAEVLGGGEQRGVGAAANERGRTRRRVRSHRKPVDISSRSY